MADFVLKVTTEQLKAKSDEMRSQIEEFEASWSQLSEIVSNSKGYWAGEASDAHQRVFAEYQAMLPQIIKRLKKHQEDLLKMAGIYEETENNASQLGRSLPEDVII